jgi:dynamin GTPase
MNDPNDFVAAYFDKSGTDEASIMSRWQRRFFILSDSQRMLYYFKVCQGA